MVLVCTTDEIFKSLLKMMQSNDKHTDNTKQDPHLPNPSKQQKTDPQLTELKGFVDTREKLEPMEEAIDRKEKKDN